MRYKLVYLIQDTRGNNSFTVPCEVIDVAKKLIYYIDGKTKENKIKICKFLINSFPDLKLSQARIIVYTLLEEEL